ncbi:MAG: T9SS type A sorting domain-containing protein, partial [Flavobacteriales bacterium]
TCTMVGNNSFSGGSLQLADAEGPGVELLLFPNPVRDGRVTLRLTGLASEKEVAAVIDVFDGLGQRVHTEQAMAAGGELNHTLDLGTRLGTGMYLVSVTVGSERSMQRLLVD